MPQELFGVVARFAYRSAVHLSAPTAVIQSLDGDGLRFEWDVLKTRTSSPDTATIRICNLMKIHRADLAMLASLPGRILVELSIGWRGVENEGPSDQLLLPTDVLFRGEDWRVVPEEQNGPDIITTIEAGDGLEVSTAAPDGGGNIALGITLGVKFALAALKLKPSKAALAVIEAEGAKVTTPISNLTLENDPRELLDVLLASMGLGWGISGGEFVVYRGGLRDDLLPGLLTPQSGLSRWAVTDDGGVEFEALAQPRFVPGMQITVSDHLGILQGGGPLRIDTIRFMGTTDGPSIMQGTARKAVL